MIYKKFFARDIVFIASFSSYESLREFEDYTGLKGASI